MSLKMRVKILRETLRLLVASACCLYKAYNFATLNPASRYCFLCHVGNSEMAELGTVLKSLRHVVVVQLMFC